MEIAVNFVKEVGQLLEELSPQGLHAIFERFRGILHEGDIDKRVQYTIEGLFAVRKSGFKDYQAIPKELDLVEREDQITFEIGMPPHIYIPSYIPLLTSLQFSITLLFSIYTSSLISPCLCIPHVSPSK